MSTTDAKIRGKLLPSHLGEALVKVNSGSATAKDVAGTNCTLADKQALEMARAGTATRAKINAMPVDLPTKEALLDIAGV
jgi:hypothetical protein